MTIVYRPTHPSAKAHLAAVLNQWFRASALSEKWSPGCPINRDYITPENVAEVQRIHALRKQRSDLRDGKVDVRFCDHYHTGDAANGLKPAALHRCFAILAARRWKKERRREAAELAALTKRAKRGVRLVLTPTTWDDERAAPPEIDRVFATAAAAKQAERRWSERYGDGVDYAVSMEAV